MIDSINDWATKIGIYPMTMPAMSCEQIITLDFKSTQIMPLEQLEEIIDKIVSYNIYIKAQKGIIESQIEVLKTDVDKLLYLETNNLGDEYKYKNIDEKKAIVRTANVKIDEQYKELIKLKCKFMKIKDIPYGIDKKIEMLKMIYSRRINDSRRIHQ